MTRSITEELDFGSILRLIAAHARTAVGRSFIVGSKTWPDRDEALRSWRLARQLEAVLVEDGRLTLAGIDDAVAWLDPAASLPVEPEALLALMTLARRIAAVKRRLGTAPPEQDLGELAAQLPDLTDLIRWAAPRLGRDGRVADDATPELGRLRRQIARVRQNLIGSLESLKRTHGSAVADAPPTLRRDRYCIPVRSSARAEVPGLVLDTSGSGATAFVEPFETVELNNELADAVAREREEVRRILTEIATAFVAHREELLVAVDVLAHVDAVQAKLAFGEVVQGRLVEPGGGDQLRLIRARHPLLDERLAGLRAEVFGAGAAQRRFDTVVPLDFELPPDVRTLVLSGPNAGGKTIVLKTIGLMVLLCAHGIPVPAEEGTRIPWYERLWCRIGDDQDVAADLSTFSGAMHATAELLGVADESTLVLYDELGNGTDPLEGAALGCALLEELQRRRCLTVTSTHLAAIAMTATSQAGMDNAAMEFDEATGQPTFALRVGRPGRSHGLEIAAAVGLDPAVVKRARDLLGGQHLELDRWLQRLEDLETQLLRDREAVERERTAAAAARLRAERAEASLRAAEAELPDTLAREVETLRARAKKKLDRVLAELDEARRHQRHVGRRVQERLRAEALDLEEGARTASANRAVEIEPGATVDVAGLANGATVEAVRGSRVQVIVRGKKMWVARDQVTASGPPAAPRRSPKIQVDAESDTPAELLLLGLDAEEARERVERYLDQALTTGRTSVRVVHGHGTGTLRRMVQEVCRSHPAVASFRHPPGPRGGTGATEIELAV